MRKLILSAAIVLGSLSTYAQAVPTESEVAKTVAVQEEYTEVKLEEVPKAIVSAVKLAYPEAVLEKAYKNTNNEYKLEVTIGEKKESLFIDQNGTWIKK